MKKRPSSGDLRRATIPGRRQQRDAKARAGRTGETNRTQQSGGNRGFQKGKNVRNIPAKAVIASWRRKAADPRTASRSGTTIPRMTKGDKGRAKDQLRRGKPPQIRGGAAAGRRRRSCSLGGPWPRRSPRSTAARKKARQRECESARQPGHIARAAAAPAASRFLGCHCWLVSSAGATSDFRDSSFPSSQTPGDGRRHVASRRR